MALKRPSIPLWSRILLLAALNLTILGIVFAVFLRLQLRPEFESFLMAEARERIASVALLVTADLQNEEAVAWSDVLDRYSREYGLTFLLYRNTGEQLAGPTTPLPPEVDVQMPRGGPPPPPPRREGREGDRQPDREREGQPPGGRAPANTPQLLPAGPPSLIIADRNPQYWVNVRMPVINGPDGEPMRSVLMLVSSTFFTNPFFFEIQPWLTIAAAAFVISALCWLPLVRSLTHSITDMMRATDRIAEGRFDVGLKQRRRDELGHLAASINLMAGRLGEFTEGRKRFLGAAAHELRSPIARMQVATEILERHADPTARKYIRDLKDDIGVMSQLTDELLQFARAESNEPVKLTATNVSDAVRTAVRRESVDGVDIRLDVDTSIQVQANADYLTRSIANIVRNAVRYAGDKGPIYLSASRHEQQVTISVTDSGPGVPEDALDKIFIPFYRLEDSRSRQSGGTGLGLAIVRSCIDACGGAVECRNRRPSGLEVIIHLKEA